MKKTGPRRKRWVLGPPIRRPAAAPRNDCRELIWVDSAPQRREESKAYATLKGNIAAVAAEIEHFQQVTLPEFERWHARSFGVLLTEQRSLQAEIEERAALVDEVRLEQWRQGGSEAAAYQRVMASRAAAGRAGEGGDHAEGDDPDDESSFEDLFRETVRHLFGVNADDLPRADREFMEAAFRRDLGRDDPPPPPPPPRRARKKEKPPTPQQTALEARCKQIYRRLVRRLHPDTGAESSPQARQLWHDLQDAWQQRDLDRLELLQAMVELQDGGDETGFAAASLDQLRRIVRELARAWRDLQKRRREVKRHPATRLGDPEKAKLLDSAIRAELQEDIRELRAEISEVDSLIARWQKSASSKKKSARPSAGQDELKF